MPNDTRPDQLNRALAMIERLIELDYPHPVRLFWGARVEEDLYLPDLPAPGADDL